MKNGNKWMNRNWSDGMMEYLVVNKRWQKMAVNGGRRITTGHQFDSRIYPPAYSYHWCFWPNTNTHIYIHTSTHYTGGRMLNGWTLPYGTRLICLRGNISALLNTRLKPSDLIVLLLMNYLFCFNFHAKQ